MTDFMHDGKAMQFGLGDAPSRREKHGMPRKRAMYIFLILSSLISLTLAQSFAQQGPFVEPVGDVKLTARQSEVLSAIKKLPTTQTAMVVRVNADALQNGNRISIQINSNNSVSIQNNSRESRDGKTIQWVGTAPSEAVGSTAIIINDNNVTASIQTSEGLYRIRPLGDGLHALVKVDTGKMPMEHPSSNN
jgi:hypothetical protein